MLDKNQHKTEPNKVISTLLIALGAIIGTSLPATAVPEIPQQIAQVRSRAIAPTPLNVTPLPGRHIPLPQGRSSYGYEYGGYDLYRDRGRYRDRYRHRDSGTTNIIIINTGNRDRYLNYRRSERIRIIRP